MVALVILSFLDFGYWIGCANCSVLSILKQEGIGYAADTVDAVVTGVTGPDPGLPPSIRFPGASMVTTPTGAPIVFVVP